MIIRLILVRIFSFMGTEKENINNKVEASSQKPRKFSSPIGLLNIMIILLFDNFNMGTLNLYFYKFNESMVSFYYYKIRLFN